MTGHIPAWSLPDMHWIADLQTSHPVAAAILVLSVVAALGMMLGKIQVRGIGLGVSGVLFAGILVGHFGAGIEHEVLEFIREFGLILFVYTIGMQVGPGFVSSLRANGLTLNLLAAAIVALGVVFTLGLAYLFHIDLAAAVGLLAGASTNTPSLGAAQQALHGVADLDPARLELPALGYAATYPLGIIGIIFSMLALRGWLRVQVAEETRQLEAQEKAARPALDRRTYAIANPNLNGVLVRDLPGITELGVILSRIRFAGETEARPVRGRTPVHLGDEVLAVGPAEALEKFRQIVGRVSDTDLRKLPGPVTSRRLVVTRTKVVGKTLRELGLTEYYDVAVTRVGRAGVEMVAAPDLKLHLGDMLQVVGEEDDLAEAEKVLGNTVKDLNHTDVLPLFIGIALGVLLGLHPFQLGHAPVPLRLGLAGGPLIAAILLSRLGRIGPVVWHMPLSANLALRQVGLVMFLGCVGLKAGPRFMATLMSAQGLLWVACGALITIGPLLLVGWAARRWLKLNYLPLCGLLAGSMTDPPALAFANNAAGSEAPSVAYATVYPLTMLLRILAAQLLILAFCR